MHIGQAATLRDFFIGLDHGPLNHFDKRVGVGVKLFSDTLLRGLWSTFIEAPPSVKDIGYK